VFIRQAPDPAVGRPAFLPRQQARDMRIVRADQLANERVGSG
jgi:hypothetical protein